MKKKIYKKEKKSSLLLKKFRLPLDKSPTISTRTVAATAFLMVPVLVSIYSCSSNLYAQESEAGATPIEKIFSRPTGHGIESSVFETEMGRRASESENGLRYVWDTKEEDTKTNKTNDKKEKKESRTDIPKQNNSVQKDTPGNTSEKNPEIQPVPQNPSPPKKEPGTSPVEGSSGDFEATGINMKHGYKCKTIGIR